MDDLARAQSDLGRALERARAGEDRELGAKVRDRGEALAHVLAGLLKLSRVHAPDNHAFDAPAAELARVLSELVELLGTVHLVTVEDQVYVNDVRVRDDARSASRDLGAELRRHGTGGLAFHLPLSDGEIRRLVRALAAPPAHGAPRRALAERLLAEGLGAVDVKGLHRFRTARPSAAGEGARTPEEVAARMLALVAETWAAAGAGRAVNPLPLRRSVLDAVEHGVALPAFWAPFRDAPTHAAHAVEVAFVGLLVARAAGFSAAFQHDLGIAALLHDAGYLAGEEAAGDDPAALERHAVAGARVLLRQRGFHAAKVRRVRAVLEHHRDFARPDGPPSAAGAILRLAEDYANVVRIYGARVTRGEALAAMLRGGGTLYHPALAQVLVNALGRHPPGEHVELEDGRRAVVAAPPASPDRFATPAVRVLDPASGRADGPLVDLAGGPAVRRALVPFAR